MIVRSSARCSGVTLDYMKRSDICAGRRGDLRISHHDDGIGRDQLTVENSRLGKQGNDLEQTQVLNTEKERVNVQIFRSNRGKLWAIQVLAHRSSSRKTRKLYQEWQSRRRRIPKGTTTSGLSYPGNCGVLVGPSW